MTPSLAARLPQSFPLGVGADLTQTSLEQLFRQHHDFVWRVAASLGVGPDAVDDVVQEVFMVAGRKLPDYEERGAGRGWLVAITRRVIADHRKRDARRVARDEQAAPPSPVEDPERHLLRRDGAQLVRRFLDELPPPQREVFVLMEIEELAAPEVARALGQKLNTIYSRLRLARERFDAYCEAIEPSEEGECHRS